MKVNGKEVEDAGRYTIAGCEREGEPMDVVCRHKGTHDTKILPATAHAALREYLKAHPIIAPQREGRVVAEDLAPVVFSQDSVVSDDSTGSPRPAHAKPKDQGAVGP